uniref:GTPase-activating protein AGD14 n=1 Tax=Lilium pumilum TaxID=82327 RepID=A0A510AB71_9LILI|nr:GTPase-activating protein AGD14 [Lilium pumilum]
MANRMKEDEKNERIIRGLLKLPANRRCINCNNLGPQYVCTNFRTFICTNCSGIHREFTHRVKSISMAKFTTQEVIALQEGGNQRAKEIYFKEWDAQRQPAPDSSNIDRLREFIKHVYVVRKYTGERNPERLPPKVKLGDREDTGEIRKLDSYRGCSRSPPYDDRYSDRLGYGGRNGPRSPDVGEYKRSPGRFEVVDDRRRDDRFGNGNQNRSSEGSRFPDGVPKQEGRSPNHQKETNVSSPPIVRPVRDILGDETPKLQVGDSPKSNSTRIPENSAQTQRTLSSSSMGSSDGTSVQPKGLNSASLIDFSADPEPPVPAAAQQSVPQQTTSPLANGENWASFDITGQMKAPQVPANESTLESELGQLSALGTATVGMPVSPVSAGSKLPQQQPSLFPANTHPVAGAVNQPWDSSMAPNLQAEFIAPAGLSSQVAPRPPQETSSGLLSQPPAEAKPSGRKALPEDLFASLYQSAPTPAPGWQRSPYFGMGMQYPTGVLQTAATAPHPSNSSNPFDLTNETVSVQVPTFPSMASLQGALPNMAGPSALLRSSSFDNPSPRWVTAQQLSYPSAVSQSPYMMQQFSSNLPQQIPNMHPMMHQGVGGPGVAGTVYRTSSMDQNSAARYPHPGTLNSLGPTGGNPFG